MGGWNGLDQLLLLKSLRIGFYIRFIKSGTLNDRKRIEKKKNNLSAHTWLSYRFCFWFGLRRLLFNILRFSEKAFCFRFVYKLPKFLLVVFTPAFPLLISQRYEKPYGRLPWAGKCL